MEQALNDLNFSVPPLVCIGNMVYEAGAGSMPE
jgi:hypothetical protein